MGRRGEWSVGVIGFWRNGNKCIDDSKLLKLKATTELDKHCKRDVAGNIHFLVTAQLPATDK